MDLLDRISFAFVVDDAKVFAARGTQIREQTRAKATTKEALARHEAHLGQHDEFAQLRGPRARVDVAVDKDKVELVKVGDVLGVAVLGVHLEQEFVEVIPAFFLGTPQIAA